MGAVACLGVAASLGVGSLQGSAPAYNASPPTFVSGYPSVLQTDINGNLKVNTAGGTIAGTVTANAGTNLNTSLLALESGGNLASIASQTNGVSTAANQTNAAQKTQMVDGGGNVIASVQGDANGILAGAASQTLTLSLSGVQSANAPLTISSGGGLNPTNQAYFDTAGLGMPVLFCTVLGTGVTNLSLYGSNDHSNWQKLLVNVYGSAYASPGTTCSPGNFISPQVPCRYYQVQLNQSQSAAATTVVMHMKAGVWATQSNTTLGPGGAAIGGLAAITTGGHASYSPVAGLAGGALTQIKSGAASFYGLDLYNPNATVEYVNFYNASSITYGTTVPIYTCVLAASSVKAIHFDLPLAFGTNLYYTTSSSAGTLTAPASAILGTVFYQ